MADAELQQHFSPSGAPLEPGVLAELRSIQSLHNITPQDLFFKWESYSIKMGGEPMAVNVKTIRDLKHDMHDQLQRDARSKAAARNDKRAHGVTPRVQKSAPGDAFGMFDGVVNTPRQPMTGINGNSVKRKGDFDSPASKTPKPHAGSSPTSARTPATRTPGEGVAFADRPNPGQVVEVINSHIAMCEAPQEPTLESRVALKANTEMKKFAYKNMAMKLSEASEVLDDRIDEFLALVQEHHELEDGAFGNPAIQSPSEIIAVGRIASDSGAEKLTAGSIVLETSRRTGAGLRVPLKLDDVPHYELFPGKMVALRGSNASGEVFTVSEILKLPLLPVAASSIADVDAANVRLLGGSDADTPRPLSVMTCAGPYTSDADLDFEPLRALCDQAEESRTDVLILVGPFLDVEHPLVVSGNFPPFPENSKVHPDRATLEDVFRSLISAPLQRLAAAQPGISIIMVPSVRDAVSRHVSWPQDRLPKKDLGLPKQCSMVTNPVVLSINELSIGICAQDALFELRPQECVGGKAPPADRRELLARLAGHLIEQRHFFPAYPPLPRENLPRPTAPETGKDMVNEQPTATGAMLDLGFFALGEWRVSRPDILVTPSSLPTFAKVVDSVVVVNPGPASKRRAAGTFARMTVKPRVLSDEERAKGEPVDHRVFERARVEVVRV